MKYLLGLILVAMLSISCDPEETFENEHSDPCESDAIVSITVEEHVSALQEFGTAIFQEVVKEERGNIIISPVSIYSALLLAAEGARCQTDDEILKVLTYNQSGSIIDTRSTYTDLMRTVLDGGEASVTYANGVFSDPGRLQISDSYKSVLEDGYFTKFFEADFSEIGSVDIVNNWASDNTNGKITEVLNEINAEDIAFLLNAIYFKGDWENGFIENPDYTMSFYPSFGDVIEVEAMAHDGVRSYYQDEELQFVDLPIKGGKYAASFLSYVDDSQINNLVASADFYDRYLEIIASSSEGRILLSLPKFELKGKLSLKGILQNMGMVKAFSETDADFSKMGSAGGNIFLTKVLHDTYLKVDEKGVEGAAVTTIGVGATSLPPVLSFDRPLVFILRHVETQIPLFMAVVQSPNE